MGAGGGGGGGCGGTIGEISPPTPTEGQWIPPIPSSDAEYMLDSSAADAEEDPVVAVVVLVAVILAGFRLGDFEISALAARRTSVEGELSVLPAPTGESSHFFESICLYCSMIFSSNFSL